MDRSIPQTGFLRLRQIVGDKTQGIPPIIPVSRSTWLAGVASGKFPKPIKLSAGVTVWRVEDIRTFIRQSP